MSFKEAARQFLDGIEDLTTIEVMTYTGELEQVVDANSERIDWSKFKPTSGELKLVAATLVRADLDALNFRASGEGIDDLEALLELHRGAVESAQSGRLALIKMIQGMIPSLLG